MKLTTISGFDSARVGHLKLVATGLLLGLGLLLPKPSQAGTLGADVIGMFPEGRRRIWLRRLKNGAHHEMVPATARAGASRAISANSKNSWLPLAMIPIPRSMKSHGRSLPKASPRKPRAPDRTLFLTGEQMVGIALGNFNQDATAAYFKRQKLPTATFHGYTLYAFGTGTGATDLFFVFIDASTAAYGHKSILEKMISVRFGDADGLMRNDKFFALINEANTGSAVWLVTNPAYTRLAIRQLAPEIEQFPEAAKLVTRMQNSIINIDAGNELDAKVQAICGSTDDANTLGQLLQAGFLYKRYQAQKDNPDLADLLNQVTITPGGDRVTLRISLSDDQMTSLIKHNTFALKM